MLGTVAYLKSNRFDHRNGGQTGVQEVRNESFFWRYSQLIALFLFDFALSWLALRALMTALS
jgi:hypothetical protein